MSSLIDFTFVVQLANFLAAYWILALFLKPAYRKARALYQEREQQRQAIRTEEDTLVTQREKARENFAQQQRELTEGLVASIRSYPFDYAQGERKLSCVESAHPEWPAKRDVSRDSKDIAHHLAERIIND